MVFLSGLACGVLPLLRGRTFFHWDNAQQHLAQTAFLGSWLRRGIWPEWWPDVGMGVPTLAEGQSAHLYPPRLLLAAVFSPPVAMGLEVGLYLGLAALMSYLFFRELRIGGTASVFGALTHAFGGLSIVLVRNVALHRSLWVLPLLFLLAERVARKPTVGVFALAALAFGLQVLSGHPTYAIVSAVSASVYLMVRVGWTSWHSDEAVRDAVRRFAVRMVVWGGAFVVGVCLGAAQLVPTLLHVPESIRAGGLDFEYATQGLTAGVAWMGQLLLPYAYALGDLRETPTAFGSYFNQNPNRGFYLGAAVPVLAIVAGLRSRSKDGITWVLLISLMVTFVFALGGGAPLFPALRAMPGMDGLRYPQRFLAPCSLLLAGIAAIGLDGLPSEAGRRGPWLRRTVVTYPVAVLAGASLFLFGRDRLEAVGIPAADLEIGLALSCGLALAAAVLVGVGLSSRRAARLATGGLVAFALVDLLGYRAIGGYARTAPLADATSPSPAASYVLEHGPGSRVLSLHTADGGTYSNRVLRELLVADLPSVWGIQTTDAYFSLMLGRRFVVQESIVWELNDDPESAAALRSFLGAMNVRFVVGPRDVALAGLRRAYEAGDVVVWENPEPAFSEKLVYDVVPESIESRFEWEARATMQRLPAFKAMLGSWALRADDAVIVDNIMADSVDFGTTAVVADTADLGLIGEGAGEVTLLDAAPDRRRYHVETDQPALLVWSQSYYPGWKATVDGEPVDIQRADYLLMGVGVPPGSHEVSFTYRTRGLRFGLVVSLATAALLVLLGTDRLRPSWKSPEASAH